MLFNLKVNSESIEFEAIDMDMAVENIVNKYIPADGNVIADLTNKKQCKILIYDKDVENILYDIDILKKEKI